MCAQKGRRRRDRSREHDPRYQRRAPSAQADYQWHDGLHWHNRGEGAKRGIVEQFLGLGQLRVHAVVIRPVASSVTA